MSCVVGNAYGGPKVLVDRRPHLRRPPLLTVLFFFFFFFFLFFSFFFFLFLLFFFFLFFLAIQSSPLSLSFRERLNSEESRKKGKKKKEAIRGDHRFASSARSLVCLSVCYVCWDVMVEGWGGQVEEERKPR